MTRAQYEQQFGTPPPVPASAPVAPAPKSGYVSPGSAEARQPIETDFGNQVKSRIQGLDDVYNNRTPAGKTNLFEKAIGTANAGLGIASDLTTDVVGKGLHIANQATGNIAGALADKAVQAAIQTPLGAQGVSAIKSGAESWDEFTQKHPRAAQDLSGIPSLLNLITTFATAGTAKAGTEIAGQVGKKVLENAAAKQAEKGAARSLNEAVARVTPEYDAAKAGDKLKLQAQRVGEKPRVNEGGFITGRTVNATSLEKEAGKELLTVPGYSNKLTHLQTENLVRPEIAKRGQALEAALKNEKVIIPKKEIVSLINSATKDLADTSLLLQKADPSIEQYMRVARNAAKQSEGTLSGVLNIRKKLDAAYENARGALSYPGSEAKLAALDEVHRAGRDSLTELLVDSAKNVDVKKSLRSQHNLYRALDIVSTKARKEGGSTLQRVVNKAKEHPLVTGAALVGTGVGIGKTFGI